MRPLALAVLLLLCGQGIGWAHDFRDEIGHEIPHDITDKYVVQTGTYEKYSDGSFTLEPTITIMTVPPDATISVIDIKDSGNAESDTDRFLREQVQPQIEAGDMMANYKPPTETTGLHSCAHYLKALVLIEQEKLRRSAR